MSFFSTKQCRNTNGQPTELSPEEEAAARAKEAAEQAALPYKWSQAIGDLDITLEVPGNLKGRDLNVDIKKTKLVVGIKGQDPIINVRLSQSYSFFLFWVLCSDT